MSFPEMQEKGVYRELLSFGIRKLDYILGTE